MAEEKIRIDYLYLDLQTCDRCIGTDKVLEEVIEELSPALELAGYSVDYHKAEIKTESAAKDYQFLSSPTIRVDGRDICGTVKESDCGCCGEISGTQVDCRVFEYKGVDYEVPPKEMLARAILSGLSMPYAEEKNSDYQLPENLKKFFAGKQEKASKCCADDSG